jgi:hypothetical protein
VDSTAVRFGYFARQCQPQARPAALGGIERQQCLSQHGLAHSRPLISYLDAQSLAAPYDLEFDRFGRPTGFVGILEQIDERLLETMARNTAGSAA